MGTDWRAIKEECHPYQSGGFRKVLPALAVLIARDQHHAQAALTRVVAPLVNVMVGTCRFTVSLRPTLCVMAK